MTDAISLLLIGSSILAGTMILGCKTSDLI